MTYDELIWFMYHRPGVADFLIQRTDTHTNFKVAKSGEQITTGDRLGTQYRCWLRTGKAFAEHTADTPEEAVRGALIGVKLPIPKELEPPKPKRKP